MNDPGPGRPRAEFALPLSRVGPVGVFVVLVAVVLAFFALGAIRDDETSPDGPAKPKRDPSPSADIVRSETKAEFASNEDLFEFDPAVIAKDTEDELRAWFAEAKRRPISDRAEDVEADWSVHLGTHDVRSPLSRLPGFVFPVLTERDRIRHEPGSHRGRLTSVHGKVESVAPQGLPAVLDPPPGAAAPERPAHLVRVTDADGDTFFVLTETPPGADLVPGQWVRAQGVFVKLRPVAGGQPGFLVWTPQSVLPSFPPLRVEAIDPAWKTEVKDRTEEESVVKPGSDGNAFWLLCNYVRTIGFAEHARRVDAGELKPLVLSRDTGAAPLKDDPDLHRFRFVRLRVGPSWPKFATEGVTIENAGQVRFVYRGYALDDQHRTVWLLSPFDGNVVAPRPTRVVTVEGYFYKRMAVTMESGGKYWMPVLVVTRFLPSDIGTQKVGDTYTKIAAWIVLGSLPVLLVLYFWLTAKNRRAREEALARHRERESKRRAGRQERDRSGDSPSGGEPADR